MSAYRVDVLDPAVTPRRIEVLAERLPPWAQSPGEAWSAEAELLALLVDHVAYLTWVTLKAAGAKNPPKPRPLARPGSARAAASQRPAAEPGPRGVKSGGWAQAARELAAIPGVVVSRDG
jgi:hypothetical protein